MSWPHMRDRCHTFFVSGRRGANVVIGANVIAQQRGAALDMQDDEQLVSLTLRKLASLTLEVILALVLALLSMRIQRVGPEQVVYSNLCGPTTSDLCYKPVLKGGFPFAYLFDAPGVSVEDQLAIPEDNFHSVPFTLDVALYFVAIVFARRAFTRRRVNRRPVHPAAE
jgi:hypothetical protein